MRFWKPKRESGGFLMGPPGGMRGALGRIMEGYKDAKIAGVTRTRHLELSGLI